MFTKLSKKGLGMKPRNYSLSVENLESRLNLSTLGTTKLIPTSTHSTTIRSLVTPKVTTVRSLMSVLATSAISPSTLNSVGVSKVVTGHLTTSTTPSDDGADALLGASTYNIGTGVSGITLTDYSGITNSKLETVNGVTDIGYVSTSGATVSYSLNVGTAGTYTLSTAVASTTAASFDIYVNGTKYTSVSFSATGSFTSYKTVNTSIVLPAGNVTLMLASTNGTQYNLSGLWATFVSATPANDSSSTTTGGTNYNVAGSGVSGVPLTGYSSITGSQLETVSGVTDIGYVSTSGATVSYSLNVASAGTYTLSTAVSSGASSASFDIYVNGTKYTSVSFSGTGSWANYKTVNTSVYLPAGTVTLKLASTNGTQYNLSGLWFTAVTTGNASTGGTTSAGDTTNTGGTTTTTTPSGTFDATVSTSNMTSFTQLNITLGSNSGDTATVTQSGSTITVTVNGVSKTYTGTFGDIVIKAGSGGDAITVDSSVSIATLLYGGTGNDVLKNLTTGSATIVSLGGGTDTVTGNGTSTAYWVGTEDAVNASSSEKSAGDVHAVASFYNGVSTTLSGQNLTDPSGTGTTVNLSYMSLWGTGPASTDVVQGQVADCYLLASLQTLAGSNAAGLMQRAVDLGDGTYAVAFTRGSTTTYVRVDGDLPSSGPYSYGLEYDHLSSSGNIWAMVIEKAYAEFRTGSMSYASLDTGSIAAVLSDLGQSYASFSPTSSTLYNTISSALASGQGVTIGTKSTILSGAALIGTHAYTVTAAFTSGGIQYVTVRNPWGFDGAGSDGNSGDGLITMPLSLLSLNMVTGAVSYS